MNIYEFRIDKNNMNLKTFIFSKNFDYLTKANGKFCLIVQKVVGRGKYLLKIFNALFRFINF